MNMNTLPTDDTGTSQSTDGVENGQGRIDYNNNDSNNNELEHAILETIFYNEMMMMEDMNTMFLPEATNSTGTVTTETENSNNSIANQVGSGAGVGVGTLPKQAQIVHSQEYQKILPNQVPQPQTLQNSAVISTPAPRNIPQSYHSLSSNQPQPIQPRQHPAMTIPSQTQVQVPVIAPAPPPQPATGYINNPLKMNADTTTIIYSPLPGMQYQNGLVPQHIQPNSNMNGTNPVVALPNVPISSQNSQINLINLAPAPTSTVNPMLQQNQTVNGQVYFTNSSNTHILPNVAANGNLQGNTNLNVQLQPNVIKQEQQIIVQQPPPVNITHAPLVSQIRPQTNGHPVNIMPQPAPVAQTLAPNPALIQQPLQHNQQLHQQQQHNQPIAIQTTGIPIPTQTNYTPIPQLQLPLQTKQMILPSQVQQPQSAPQQQQQQQTTTQIKFQSHPITSNTVPVQISPKQVVPVTAATTATATNVTIAQQQHIRTKQNNAQPVSSASQAKAKQLVAQFQTLASRLGISLPNNVLNDLTTAAAINEANASKDEPLSELKDSSGMFGGKTNGSENITLNASFSPPSSPSSSVAASSTIPTFMKQLEATADAAISAVVDNPKRKYVYGEDDNLGPALPPTKRKKKATKEDCERKLQDLKEENETLKRHLEMVKNKTAQFERERKTQEQKMKGLVTLSSSSKGADDAALQKELEDNLKQFSNMYSDYGQHRQEELFFHLNQLEKYSAPTTFTKMSLWTLGQKESFFTQPKHHPISGILRKELGITPAQGRKIVAQRFKIQQLCANIKEVLQLIADLKALCQKKQKVFSDRMSKCQEILRSEQVTKLLVWINDNSNVLESACPGWGSERIRERGQEQNKKSTEDNSNSNHPDNGTSDKSDSQPPLGAQDKSK